MAETLMDKFCARVLFAAPGECWLWKGYRDERGYGRYGHTMAHRLAYELIVGPIPEGLTIDHLCQVHDCVNPEHMEPVTLAENSRRSYGWRQRRARANARTHCSHGHAYADFRPYIAAKGTRTCGECMRLSNRKTSERRKRERHARGLLTKPRGGSSCLRPHSRM